MTDLKAAIKNALDRGQEIGSIKKSLVNAGYPLEEIEKAFQLNNYSPIPETQSLPITKKEKKGLFSKRKKKNKPEVKLKKPLVQKKISKKVTKLPKQVRPTKTNRWLVAILIILSLIIIVGAGLLGVYWEQLFKY